MGQKGQKGRKKGTVAFTHIGLACRDIAATEAFYVRHFGFRRSRTIGDGATQIVFLRGEGNDCRLELFVAKGEPPAPPVLGTGPEFAGFRHLAFEVDAIDEKLRQMGNEARVTRAPLDLGHVIPDCRAVWVSDPDDRIVEIIQNYTDAEAGR